MVDTSWSVKFGTVSIVAASEIRTGFGPNIRFDTAGYGLPYVQRLGDAPDLIRLQCWIDPTYSSAFRNELKRTEPILVYGDATYNPLGDLYTGGSIYVYPLRPEHISSPTQAGVDYRVVELPLVVLGDVANFKRCTKYSAQLYPNTFDLSGSIIVPLPIGVSSVSETSSPISRVSSGGTIPCYAAPTLETITYTVAEENLTLGNVAITRSGREWQVSNGLIKLQSRNDEGSNLGRWDFSVWDGTQWVSYGTVGFAVKSSTGTVEYLDDKPPDVAPLFKKRNKERETLVVTYPESTTNNYKIRVHITVWRGKPYAQITVTNMSTTISLVEARVRVNMALTSMRYHTRSGTTRDATASAYGEETTAGDSDTYPYSVLHDEDPMAATTSMCGFMRFKKADHDHVANDAGNYWDSVAAKFDNLSIELAQPFPHFILFGQKQSATGTAVTVLDDEAFISINAYQTVTEVT